jgi:hypothetical protein
MLRRRWKFWKLKLATRWMEDYLAAHLDDNCTHSGFIGGSIREGAHPGVRFEFNASKKGFQTRTDVFHDRVDLCGACGGQGFQTRTDIFHDGGR